MPGPLSSPVGSAWLKTTVPGVKSQTTETWAWPVAPVALVATALMTLVPPWIGSETLQLPSPAAVVVAVVVAEFMSVLVAATYDLVAGRGSPGDRDRWTGRPPTGSPAR